jgi:alcohol dehydrogenase class IV
LLKSSQTDVKSFRHVTPATRTHYGYDSLNRIPDEVSRAELKRVAIFCGASVQRMTEPMERVRQALGSSYAGTFDGVKAQSPLTAVKAGEQALRELGADAVIAIGGGSAIVTARASSILLAEGGDIHALCTRFPKGGAPISPKLSRPKLPQFVIPTTPTTAYATAGSAVVDPATGQRLSLFDPKTRAAVLFFDPAMGLSSPRELVLHAALDAFALAVQGIESSVRDPLADALLLHAIRLLHQHLPLLLTHPDDASIRGQLMLAALLAGQGTDFTASGVTSVIGHSVGARYHLENGLTKSIVLPHAIRFNERATGARSALIAEALGVADIDTTKAATVAAEAVARFFSQLKLPTRLRDIGLGQEALPLIAEDAMLDWFLHQNPRKISGPAELVGLLEQAL